MKRERNNSLDPLEISEWRWSEFLDDAIKALELFDIEPYPIPEEFLTKEETIKFKNNQIKVKALTWACRTTKIRQARAACIEAGPAASVLNLVINPFHNFELPFFGADFVTLPSGHLLALDLQPVLKKDEIHNQKVWSKLIPIHDHWQSLLPSGGPIPQEAETFFSPGFLWTRLPLDDQGSKLISKVIRPAFQEYLTLYIDLISDAQEVSKERSLEILSGQKAYINYRAEKDPARGMLARFFGKDWTEQYIHKVLFDL
ncbi:phycoerythrobilin:ferredoxin oxidoreductase [Prochlorococcus marinus]|uniref:Phycoerythrobilin:ferredoxin oxidoreductase n=1 Tax=Prochlorococcus marinus (strain MIT 9211) TaxID=93059 RepID=PEBB_PROM4|nr:phycoerythrobilin:ferredoxin oxidoreductase [Prochlorococcus marinus]A9BCT2.1 RecName: Full=Phycoerythrobilin:ferredoxin oxidoreductase [Prochlorococcus marinus str. MIT 9211]ABX09644.1 phycoerythrobilin:ferredoxin oxidoreductase [Prochlorococcus marinus str. MIT 9211]